MNDMPESIPLNGTVGHQSESTSRRAWTLFLLLGLIWGMPYLLIRIALEDLHPFVVAGGRAAVGALVMLPFVLRGSALLDALREWKWLALYTSAEIVAPWVLIAYAEIHVSSAAAGLIIALTPLIAALSMTTLGLERLGWRRLAGLVLGFLGLAAVYGLDLRAAEPLAVVALMLSAIGYALGPIIAAKKLSHLQPIGVVTGSLIFALLFYLPFMVFFRPEAVSLPAVGAVVGLGLICTALAFILLFSLIAEVGPARSTVIAYLNPAVALLLGATFLGEALTIGMGLGLVLIVLGSILATHKEGRKPVTTESSLAEPQ